MYEGIASAELLNKLATLVHLPPSIEAERTRMNEVQEAVDQERTREHPEPLYKYPVTKNLYEHQVRAANSKFSKAIPITSFLNYKVPFSQRPWSRSLEIRLNLSSSNLNKNSKITPASAKQIAGYKVIAILIPLSAEPVCVWLAT